MFNRTMDMTLRHFETVTTVAFGRYCFILFIFCQKDIYSFYLVDHFIGSTTLKKINIYINTHTNILSTEMCRDQYKKLVYSTLTGQKYFRTKIFPYIFHIKPLIFITFSWSHSLADFHEIFTFNSRIIKSLF